MKHQSLFNRLRRIEGQIRGIEEMTANNKPEQDILIQLEAAKSALAAATVNLIEDIVKVDGESVTIPADQARAILKIVKKS
ncbi:MAG: metal-sensing transcriptional repressor [Patescibacteria group bacterium]|jgi:DNA-binding FrmR family transcriptional regulator